MPSGERRPLGDLELNVGAVELNKLAAPLVEPNKLAAPIVPTSAVKHKVFEVLRDANVLRRSRGRVELLGHPASLWRSSCPHIVDKICGTLDRVQRRLRRGDIDVAAAAVRGLTAAPPKGVPRKCSPKILLRVALCLALAVRLSSNALDHDHMAKARLLRLLVASLHLSTLSASPNEGALQDQLWIVATGVIEQVLNTIVSDDAFPWSPDDLVEACLSVPKLPISFLRKTTPLENETLEYELLEARARLIVVALWCPEFKMPALRGFEAAQFDVNADIAPRRGKSFEPEACNIRLLWKVLKEFSPMKRDGFGAEFARHILRKNSFLQAALQAHVPKLLAAKAPHVNADLSYELSSIMVSDLPLEIAPEEPSSTGSVAAFLPEEASCRAGWPPATYCSLHDEDVPAAALPPEEVSCHAERPSATYGSLHDADVPAAAFPPDEVPCHAERPSATYCSLRNEDVPAAALRPEEVSCHAERPPTTYCSLHDDDVPAAALPPEEVLCHVERPPAACCSLHDETVPAAACPEEAYCHVEQPLAKHRCLYVNGVPAFQMHIPVISMTGHSGGAKAEIMPLELHIRALRAEIAASRHGFPVSRGLRITPPPLPHL